MIIIFSCTNPAQESVKSQQTCKSYMRRQRTAPYEPFSDSSLKSLSTAYMGTGSTTFLKKICLETVESNTTSNWLCMCYIHIYKICGKNDKECF